MPLFGRSKKPAAPSAPAAAPVSGAAAWAASAAAARAAQPAQPAKPAQPPRPAAPPPSTFDAARYGQVPDSEIGVDPVLGDATLAAAVRAAGAGQWRPVAEALAETVGDWDRRFLHMGVLAGEASASDWLQSWQRAEPNSADAAILFAMVTQNTAGEVRGSQSAEETTREQFEGFHRLSRDAAKAAQRAIDLAPEDPTPWVTRILAALGQQLPNEQFLQIWEGLIERAPQHRRGHTYAHQYWLAKWFGSDELAEQFVTEACERAPGSILAFELRVHFAAERWLATSRKVPLLEHFRTGEGRPLVEAALADYWTGVLPEGDGLAVVDGNMLAWALTNAERWDEACDVWEWLRGRRSYGYPWNYFKNGDGGYRLSRQMAFEKSPQRNAG